MVCAGFLDFFVRLMGTSTIDGKNTDNFAQLQVYICGKEKKKHVIGVMNGTHSIES